MDRVFAEFPMTGTDGMDAGETDGTDALRSVT